MNRSLFRLAFLTLVLSLPSLAAAEVQLSNVFTDHMVLQRDFENPVWGWDEPGTEVTVTIKDQKKTAQANDDGRWEVQLDPLPAGGPHQLAIQGTSDKTIEDVLIGEVWVCSGQSNMAWTVSNSDNSDLARLTADRPQIRLLSVPNRASQDSEKNFNGAWQVCSPETVNGFSAVGYFFGRQLQETLDVPVGLIDNAWGGSAAEAWIQRDVIENDDRFAALMDRWKKIEQNHDHDAAMKKYEAALEKWKAASKKAKEAGKPQPNRPRRPRNPLTGNHRPGNLYGGCLHPIVGYGIQGVIWYQGESNSGRAYQYRDLFPKMITHWRDVWGQGDFSFYWVSLADYRREVDKPGPSSWAELREAQTMTLSLPNTGEAIITDLGEADDIHPRNKEDVALRLARHALKFDYGYDIVARSPRYKSHEIQGNKVRVTFQNVGSGLDTFDVREPVGFAIAGEDQNFHPAQARIIGKDQIEVWSDKVSDPVAVRYAWADNPVCNVQNRLGLPLTPFRTDDWKGVTADAE